HDAHGGDPPRFDRAGAGRPRRPPGRPPPRDPGPPPLRRDGVTPLRRRSPAPALLSGARRPRRRPLRERSAPSPAPTAPGLGARRSGLGSAPPALDARR